MICASLQTELVGKFLEMLQRREGDLKMLNATCVSSFSVAHLKKLHCRRIFEIVYRWGTETIGLMCKSELIT